MIISMELFLAFTVLLATHVAEGQWQQRGACEQGSCYPATGDLLIGRQDRLFSSSTCGLNTRERYCIVSYLGEKASNQCFYCDSRYPYQENSYYQQSHRIENIVSDFSRRWRNRWWQAENGKENVYTQLDLEGEFHFTHLIMRFKTFRPAAMLVERSHDFGKTWKVYRYFAHDCQESFPGVPTSPIRDITDVICESRYSGVAPSTEGEVIFRVLPPSVDIENPYSQEVQDLLKMTNLRVNFTKLHTLGDNLLDSRDTVKEKYYYSMYDMVVRGSCSCYGHADRCIPLPGQSDDPNMVHGKCDCTHNTKGINCQECEDFYNDLPWRPAQGREPQSCKRCECHGHAMSCHFDPAIYELTGRVSGGVCDECEHNTMGRNCEECKPFFFHDPSRTIDDPNACRPCDCDPVGSEHGGECESRTDVANDLVAGRCICKRFVEGVRCDLCRNGYWNLRDDSPEGCEPCACSTLGTVGNYGCDKSSGECRCKRFVTGRNCDQCYPGYWGLGDSLEGCQACDCDAGGAFDNNCDIITGQCKCRPNIRGRRCDQTVAGYFLPLLDFMKYEGEFANPGGNAQVLVRDRVPGRPVTWTGPGFMKVMEGDFIEFIIDDISKSMEYEILIRYEPQMRERWDDVRVTIQRPEAIDQSGPCANTIPQDDLKALSLPSVRQGLASPRIDLEDGSGDFDGDNELIFGRGDLPLPKRATNKDFKGVGYQSDAQVVQEWELQGALQESGVRYFLVTPPTCLETGLTYTLRLEFPRYKSGSSTPQASILIDSIALIPSPNSIGIFVGSGLPERRKQEYEYYNCHDTQLPVNKRDFVDVCRNLIFSISAEMFEGARDCQCDPTGSHSAMCNPVGGQCECKNNVIGRRCNKCAPATYGFGQTGCQQCNCNAIGSDNNYCDQTTGQCDCRSMVYGQQCDQCERGFWGFPNCQPCRCNGRADECTNDIGACIECRDNTGGHYCDQCAPAYYGDPRPGSGIGCRPCMCPGGSNSGYQHGDTCRLDSRYNRVICDCEAGYTGDRCDQCADNHYGNPLIPGGTCQPCLCNGNIDPDMPGSCDAATGECLKCLYNTEGFNCETCKYGYYGDATQHSCLECNCYLLGWDRAAGMCNRETGQCPCLPNVVGRDCGQCAPNHWRIASGEGCETCGCDLTGSYSPKCNEFTGQCECKPGRGGRDCSECPDLYWGNPRVQCFPCNCNQEGSDTLQCNRETGHCVCSEGVAGDKCDRCARGTTGELPYCVPCGECFDNWDRTVIELRDETDRLIKEGSEIKVGGAPGAFEKEFQWMEDRIEDIRRILGQSNITEEDIDKIRVQLDVIRQNLTDSESTLNDLNGDIFDTEGRVEKANMRMEDIRRRVDNLKIKAQELKDNATNIREKDITGAFNSTKESQRRSQAAQDKVDSTIVTVGESAKVREEVEQLIDDNEDSFNEKMLENQENLDDVDGQISGIEDKIAELNEIVCDAATYPCDSRCGGAGCGKCGGTSCDGAVDKANTALDWAQESEEILREKDLQASNLLTEVRDAQTQVNMSKSDAQMAYDQALAAKNQSEQARADIEMLIQTIDDFLSSKAARPNDVRVVAEEVLAMSISLTPQEIIELVVKINETIRNLKNIDNILEDAQRDLKEAEDLRDRATAAKQNAEDILALTQQIMEALARAREAQEAAEEAIEQAEGDITAAERDLAMVENQTSIAESSSQKTLQLVLDLQNRLRELIKKYTENEENVKLAIEEAAKAEDEANKAEENANNLNVQYEQVTIRIQTRYNLTMNQKERAERLITEARQLYQDTSNKRDTLLQMEVMFRKNEEMIINIAASVKDLLERTEKYTDDIIYWAQYSRNC